MNLAPVNNCPPAIAGPGGAKQVKTNANRLWPVLLVMACLLPVIVFPPGCESFAPQSPNSVDQADKAKLDDDYVAALAVTNDFCRAWRDRDLPMGRTMLTRRMIAQYSDARLAGALVGGANPSHGAFEIFKGRRLGAQRYEFKIRLFLRYKGQLIDRIEAPVQRIVLVNAGDRWLVDEFPIP